MLFRSGLICHVENVLEQEIHLRKKVADDLIYVKGAKYVNAKNVNVRTYASWQAILQNAGICVSLKCQMMSIKKMLHEQLLCVL
mgnify:CR=1 FL=1